LDRGVSIKPCSLRAFYKKSKVGYYVANYQYQQAVARPQWKVQEFAVALARLVQDKSIVVYTDESSFNMWIKMRSTWMNMDEPVKIILNKHRGNGITVIGAISEHLASPLFMLAKSTNSEDFMAFLKQLRNRFSYCKSTTIHLVLDNAAAHHNNFVKLLAAKLKIELMFLPAYTPELNPIEALWGIIKRDFKQRLMQTKHIVKEQPQFRELLQASLDAITPEVQ
jgi:transposase